MEDITKMTKSDLQPNHENDRAAPLLSRKHDCLSMLIDGSTSKNTPRGNRPHRRSASDSLALKRYFDSMILKPINGTKDNKIINTTENVSDKNPSSDDVEVAIAQGSSTKIGQETDTKSKCDPKMGPHMDPKMRRILANRLSSQKSRLKKTERIAELEQRASELQAKVKFLYGQCTCYNSKRMMIRKENVAIKERIAHLKDEEAFKNAQTELLKEQKQRIMQRQLEKEHQQKTEEEMIKGFASIEEPAFNMNDFFM